MGHLCSRQEQKEESGGIVRDILQTLLRVLGVLPQARLDDVKSH